MLQLSRGHRIVLLKLMETIIKEQIGELKDEMAQKLISLGSSELTQSQVREVERVGVGGWGLGVERSERDSNVGLLGRHSPRGGCWIFTEGFSLRGSGVVLNICMKVALICMPVFTTNVSPFFLLPISSYFHRMWSQTGKQQLRIC